MIGEQTNDAEAVALRALGWMLGEHQRAARFLALTGLNPEALRHRIGEPALLAATLRFLEAFEPDLIACADAIGVAPGELVAARRTLEP
jgi:uncharacterized protein DUF3572